MLSEIDKRRRISIWLFTVAGMVAFMVVLGGVTRLTESGLSMTDWRPVTGWLPPLSAEEWVAEFEKYKTSPEYKKINNWMQVDDFKGIFWLEYLHRLMGRLIGLAYALPFFYFLARRQIPQGMGWPLFGLLVLGGMQGVMGWLMVQSGLVDRPSVSQYRLAAHLGLALIIYAALIWTAVKTLWPRQGILRAAPLWVGGLVAIQIVSGAFVAGLDAGHIYNTWPLMDGALIPNGLFAWDPGWLAIFEHNLTVQFLHRCGAYLVGLAVLILWWRTRHLGWPVHLLLGSVVLQVLLGITTLVLAVPIWLGAAHQAGALLVMTAFSLLIHFRRRSVGVTP